MIRGQLADLDELVLHCRDDWARQYISEAVACYKAGAFRSCIVATWVAVVYDFIHKLQELDLAGDKNAKAKLEEFQKIQGQNDLQGALRFEKQVLDGLKEFELVSPLEYEDLKRLLEDRNRCAHPSMNSLEEIYQPPAELARYHLRNAVTHLLQHPPVQGQAALERLKREVDSPYFPTTTIAAKKYFAGGPLARPREALVRNFIVVLLKQLLLDELDNSKEQRCAAALNAVRQMQRSVAERTLEEKLSDIIRTISDGELLKVVKFLHIAPDAWQILPQDIRWRVERYVEEMPTGDLTPGLPLALESSPLKVKAAERLKVITARELSELIAYKPKPEYVDVAIELYRVSESFNEANAKADRLILPLVSFFQPAHYQKLLDAAEENDQIKESYQFYQVQEALEKLFNDEASAEDIPF